MAPIYLVTLGAVFMVVGWLIARFLGTEIDRYGLVWYARAGFTILVGSVAVAVGIIWAVVAVVAGLLA